MSVDVKYYRERIEARRGILGEMCDHESKAVRLSFGVPVTVNDLEALLDAYESAHREFRADVEAQALRSKDPPSNLNHGHQRHDTDEPHRDR